MGKTDNNVHTRYDQDAVAALAQAMTLARKGRSGTLKDQRYGTVDARRLARAGVGDDRIFERRGAPAPNKVRVTILLDASSSMMGWADTQRVMDMACQVGRDLAGATDRLPWITADIVAFTTGNGQVALYPLWKTGEPTSDVDVYGFIPMGGTEEGYAIAFAFDELQDRLQKREQGLIIIVSDGAPYEPVHVKSVVDMAKKQKVPVVSVALVKSAVQNAMYGRDNVVQYEGSARVLARRMAQVIGRVL